MGDIRNWDAYRAGRWNWSSLGYDDAFPGRIGIGDLDGHVEMRGHHLFIECKSRGELPTGQRLALESLNRRHGHSVMVLTGDASQNDPQSVGIWLPDGKRLQVIKDGMSVEERRLTLMSSFQRWASWAQANEWRTA